MDNDLSNLADHLFKQLDRLDNAEGCDEISQEKDRSQAMVNVAAMIIDTASLTLKAHLELNTGMPKPTPKLLGAGK